MVRRAALLAGSVFATFLFAPTVPLAAGRTGEPPPADPYRQAILVGVWKYDPNSVDELADMTPDMAALEKAFRDIHFDKVTRIPNPTKAEFEKALTDAAAEADSQSLNRATLTVVYFAGHGTMVGNTSYLLAKDYVPPEHPSKVARSGAVSTEFVGKILSSRNQPSLLIVEACRNAFVPSNATTTAADPASRAKPKPATLGDRMIGRPLVDYPIQAVYFGQAPGQTIDIAPRNGKATPLVEALSVQLAKDGAVVSLFARVKKQVLDLTQGAHPQSGQLFHDSAGEMFLYYNAGSIAYDTFTWEATRDALQPQEQAKSVLIGFPTSRHAAAARRLASGQGLQTAQTKKYLTFSPNILAMLAYRPTSAPPQRPVVLASDAGLEASGASADISLVRRLSAIGLPPVFEFRTTQGKTFQLTGPVPLADPTKTPDFWSGPSVTKVECPATMIREGACPAFEEAVAATKGSAPEKVGTLFIATIFNLKDDANSAREVYERSLAIDARLKALSIPAEAIALRSFYGNDIPRVDAPILIRRGDSEPLSSVETRDVQ